jgi:SAM-dependent methyltransferase
MKRSGEEMIAKRAIERFLQRTREFGWAQATSQALSAATRAAFPQTSDLFDREHQIDTLREVPLWRLNIASENAQFGIKYQTVHPDVFKNALGLVPGSPTEYVFVDLGCGKGRTLILASELRFRKVIGVEFAPQLAAIARSNISKTGSNVEIYEGDAQTYQLPSDDLVVYMFNPFGPPVLTHVIENLASWRTQNSKKAFLIYLNPVHASLFESNPGFAPMASAPGVRVWVF